MGSKYFLLLIITLSAFGAFFAIADSPLLDWDESRRGVNAIRMVQTGDYLNYRYVDEIDNFNTKPPLFTWLTALVFLTIGPSVFALRLVSALACVAFMAYVYTYLQWTKGTKQATIVCGLLLVVSGILGDHVARSGDTDMLFVLFVTVAIFGLLTSAAKKRIGYLYTVIISLFLAFMTKGLALMIVLPGMAAWCYMYRRQFGVNRKLGFRLLAFVGALSAVSILLLLNFNTESLEYQSLFHAMFLNDGVRRFTDSSFESGYKWDYLPVVLDVKFGPVIYFLYAAAVYYLFTRGVKRIWMKVKADPLLLMSVLTLVSACIVLSLSQNKHQWYIAPVILPLAIICSRPLLGLYHKTQLGKYMLLGGFSILFVLRVISWDSKATSNESTYAFSSSATKVGIPITTPQSCVFKAYLANVGGEVEFELLEIGEEADMGILTCD